MQERYTVERRLGHGGMATVYLARDNALDRPVALKILSDLLAEDEAFRERFLREARLAARFHHPNVVQVYDVGEDERGPFIVMEYVDGVTLADELGRRRRLPAGEVVAIGIQVCAALEAAHAAGLVHRDIKPQNILLRPDGQVKIADFGIARSLAATQHTELGTVLGTAAYLAPEQARGEQVTPAADIYSLGVVLYELLTGKTPFTGDTLTELLLKREREPVVPPRDLEPGVPLALERIVMRCLALRPEARPASAAALARELAESTSGTVTRATAILPATTRSRRRGVLVAGVLAAILVATALAVALVERGSGPRATAKTTTQAAATAPTTTAPTTTTTPTTTAPPPPTTTAPPTPDQALANARSAIAQAAASGQLDPSQANDLNHHLDDLAQALQSGNPHAATHTLADFERRLSQLARHGQLTSAGLDAISAPLAQLGGSLPAPGPGDQGDEGGGGG